MPAQVQLYTRSNGRATGVPICFELKMAILYITLYSVRFKLIWQFSYIVLSSVRFELSYIVLLSVHFELKAAVFVHHTIK